ncbi:hypothetical protein OG746_45385 [Streptomyces sp. NBC_01016]|uniref:hypothetical protein n=1 Tax=Streptomyces sp. NBC_01016 TaxID=2903720 RepID=UPI00224CA3D1|nr:hypothetical protein [Streptomyces sp. NBC_01016]MCX4832323.1 hypothetical protein [Streptomyces sp. NBC_01016]MCX4835947.1 hypothetical protein [Streptomyces sp. NBC_01016]
MEGKEAAQVELNAASARARSEGPTEENVTAFEDAVIRLAAAHGVTLAPAAPATGQLRTDPS